MHSDTLFPGPASRRPSRLRSAVCGALFATLTLPAAAGADGLTGSLVQLPEPDGCVAETGDGTFCTDGVGLFGVHGVAASPDGKHVYVAASSGKAVAAFARDRTTGALAQLPGLAACVSEDGSGGACADGIALDGANAVVVSPDGKHVYLTAFLGDAVAAFRRDRKTGALTQLPGLAACVSDDGSSGLCADGIALAGPASLAISPDGKHVYVAAKGSAAVAAFARDKKTGALTQLPGLAACVSNTGSGPCADGTAIGEPTSVAVSSDGRHVYVASRVSSAVAVFARDRKTGALTQLSGLAGCISETGAGPCTDGVGLAGAYGVAISGDGKHVYVAAFDGGAVAAFKRDKRTGALTQLPGLAACVSEDGSGGACVDGVALVGPVELAVSRDGKNAYVVSLQSGAVAAFDRDRRTGALTQLPDLAACVSVDGTGGACVNGVALHSLLGIALTRDGRHAYIASGGENAVAVFDRIVPSR